MPLFRYTAVNSKGESVSGSLDATDADEAKKQLEIQGLRIQALVEDQTQTAPPEPQETIRQKDADQLGQHIADLTSAGLPVEPGLRALADELQSESWLPQRMPRLLRTVANKLDAGEALGDVMTRYKVPTDLRSIIAAGMQQGRTPEAVGEYATHLRAVDNNAKFAAITLSYPIMVMVAVGGLTVFVMGYVVPQFKKIFEDFGIELPAITQAIINISDGFVRLIPFEPTLKVVITLVVCIGLAVVLIPYLLIKAMACSNGAKRIRNRIPMLGRIFQWSAMAKFSHLIAVLINHQVPLPNALRFAGEGCEDPDIHDACIDLATQIESGVDRPGLSVQLDGFPSGFLQLLAAESDRDGIPEAMHAIANMYERRVRMQSSVLAGFLEPFILVFCIAMPIGILVLAMFMPLIRLLNDLS